MLLPKTQSLFALVGEIRGGDIAKRRNLADRSDTIIGRYSIALFERSYRDLDRLGAWNSDRTRFACLLLCRTQRYKNESTRLMEEDTQELVMSTDSG